MSERALVARHDRANQYDLYRSQWAETGRLIDAAVCGRCPVDEMREEWDRCGRSDWSGLIDELDYLGLDLCLRCDPGSVSVFVPVWLGIPTGERDETDPTCGVLVRVESEADRSRLRERVRRRKEQLGTAIESGALGRRAARWILLAVAGSRERYLSASVSECVGPSE